MADIFHANLFFPDGEPEISLIPATHEGRMRMHSHEFFEVVYVTDGFTLHSDDGNMNLLVAGDLFFVKPGEEHSYINAHQTRLYNLIFMPTEIEPFRETLSALPGLDDMLNVGSSRQFVRLLHIPMNERFAFEASLRAIGDERTERKNGWELSVRLKLLQFLISYSRMFSERWDDNPQGADDYYGHICKVLRYIDANYSRELSMADLSSVTGLSTDYMGRKFKAVLNMTPSEYLRKFRIARAMELLCTTDCPIAEIAGRTGFSDVSLFSRVFKQSVGIPPISYRKNATD